MLCKNPYTRGQQSHGCGQCTPCRINLRRLWIGRMILEAAEHPFSCFVTLTYEDYQPCRAWLQKKPLQLFLKRLREEFAPRRIRYFACGEYGEKNCRAHYHALLFGVSPTEEARIKKCWPSGFIKVGTCEPASMSYVAGYVIKKMTKKEDKRLLGRPPEFSLMSKKPGLGFGAVARIAAAYRTSPGEVSLSKNGWIAAAIRSYGFKYPLGRYLRTKVEEQLGLSLACKTVYKEAVYRAIAERFKGETAEERERRYAICRTNEEGRRHAFWKRRKTL